MNSQKELTFKFRGKTYKFTGNWSREALCETPEFQLKQFEYLVQEKDWVTMKNRINRLLLVGLLEEISYIK